MDVDHVALEVEKDIDFFRTSGGGVTLSGGEPTLFMDFTSRLLERLTSGEIHTIVETCGYFDLGLFEEYVLPNTDAVYFDLKIFDAELHARECGVSNETILENFASLVEICADEGRELLPRVPLVPGITALDENLRALARFIGECGADRVALLEYNPLWLDKNRKLGRVSPHEANERMRAWMERADIEACRAAFDGLTLV
jgi:pyruvate formate lyase activating enzyme